MSQFKKKYSFSHRQNESYSIQLKYPDRIPVICEKSHEKDTSIPNIDKNKYLVPSDLTVGQFAYVIRKRIRIPSERILFLLINNSLRISPESIV